MLRRVRALALVGAALVCGGASGAPQRVVVWGEHATCPSAEQLIRALAPLLPSATFSRAADVDAHASIELTDEAAPSSAYSIGVDGFERRFTDVRHDCSERARVAAVFAALALAPPSIVVSPPSHAVVSPSSRAVVSPPSRAVVSPPPRPRLEWRRFASTIELVAQGSGALRRAGADQLASGGGAVRVTVGARGLSAVLGIGASSPITIDLGIGSTTVLRFPIDLGLRGAYRRGRFEGLVDIGLALVPMRLAGDAIPNAQVGARVDIGLRTAVGLRIWLEDRVALLAALEANVFPRPYAIAVEPVGDLGETPVAWLSGQVGLAVRLR